MVRGKKMKNPLRKRLPRELKTEFGKYLVIFLLLVATIGLVSGFLVADGSMIIAYNEGFEKYNVRPGIDELRIQLKYHEGTSVITEIYRVSTPGRRVYSSVRDLPRVYNGLGISIVSTPKGVMSDNEARKANVGGEILCQVF